VTDDLERFAFNRAVAHIREFANLLADLPGGDAAAARLRRAGLKTLVQLIGPMMPHLAEEVWQRLGHAGLLADQPWPVADPAQIVEERVTLGVQVNGKLRGTLDLDRDASETVASAAALALPAVVRLLDGRAPRKVVVVPNRIVNVVV
jgi:leucyl-tRNA synthetase